MRPAEYAHVLLHINSGGQRGMEQEPDVSATNAPTASARPPSSANTNGARRAPVVIEYSRLRTRYTNALWPVRCRPMMSFWIWLVPSYRVVTRASRR